MFKSLNKAISTPIAIIIIIVIGVLAIGGVLAYQYWWAPEAPAPAPTTTPSSNKELQLTQEQAQALVLQTWGGCTRDTCESVTVTVQDNNGQYTVTAIYEGLRDDSISAQKKVAPAYYSNNVWTLGNATVTQRCQPGRGHQDFSAELCF